MSGLEAFTQLITDAVASGADTIEVEYESGGGLEIMFIAGNTGAGYVLDGDLGRDLREAIYEKKKERRRTRVTVDGTEYTVQISTYESFGETAYRLTLRKARNK